MRRVPESDYSVTVGGLPCTGLDINEAGTAITCLPPQSGSTTIGLDYLTVIVSIRHKILRKPLLPAVLFLVSLTFSGLSSTGHSEDFSLFLYAVCIRRIKDIRTYVRTYLITFQHTL